jgi:hypothetical protein
MMALENKRISYLMSFFMELERTVTDDVGWFYLQTIAIKVLQQFNSGLCRDFKKIQS